MAPGGHTIATPNETALLRPRRRRAAQCPSGQLRLGFVFAKITGGSRAPPRRESRQPDHVHRDERRFRRPVAEATEGVPSPTLNRSAVGSDEHGTRLPKRFPQRPMRDCPFPLPSRVLLSSPGAKGRDASDACFRPPLCSPRGRSADRVRPVILASSTVRRFFGQRRWFRCGLRCGGLSPEGWIVCGRWWLRSGTLLFRNVRALLRV